VVGRNATITTSIIAGQDDYLVDSVDFYYADSASSNPKWTYIGTKSPKTSGESYLSVEYTLPTGTIQAVRVSMRYRGDASSCDIGYYSEFTDVDDLAFRVKQNS
jgi:leucyl aminopeptidase